MKDGNGNETPRHPIQIVARRTGLSTDLIRVWEKRYGAVDPVRTSTGRRLYSDEELERLDLLHRATSSGRRIGDVAHLATESLRGLVAEDLRSMPPVRPAGDPDASPREILESCLEAVRSLDTGRLDGMLHRALASLGVRSLIGEVLEPLVRRIGDSWQEGSLDPFHEHFTTISVRRLLSGIITSAASAAPAPGLVVATPPRQHHELGAMMVGAEATVLGWRVVYLGPNLPVDDIAKAARGLAARGAALSLVYPDVDERLLTELRRLRRDMGGSRFVLAGGAGVRGHEEALEALGVLVFQQGSDLEPILRRLALTR